MITELAIAGLEVLLFVFFVCIFLALCSLNHLVLKHLVGNAFFDLIQSLGSALWLLGIQIHGSLILSEIAIVHSARQRTGPHHFKRRLGRIEGWINGE